MGISAVEGDGTVTLGWSSISAVTSYNIYRSLVSGSTGTVIASVNSLVTSYTDTNLTNGTSYYYNVGAENGDAEIALSGQVSATPVASPGPFIISGTIQYQDKIYGSNGFSGVKPYKAVRYATVDLDLVSGSTVTSTTTDSTGFFSITLASAPTSTVYISVLADAFPGNGSSELTVRDSSYNSIYAADGNDFYVSGSANVTIYIPVATSGGLIGGAFNILDVLTNGFMFDHSLEGSYPPNLTAYWAENNCNGTFYCPGSSCGGEGIYVLNDPTGSCLYSNGADTDEYDDDVLYHEFGHFTAAHFSQDDSPGGQHMLTSNDIDLRLSWSEGWGDQMPGAVKMWLSKTGQASLLSSDSTVPLTEYVDTSGNGTVSGAWIAVDMDNPSASYPSINPVYFSYASGEVAVAKILLDLNKNFGMPDVWSVFNNFQTNHPVPVSLELFWDEWLASQPTSTGSITVGSIFANRRVYYSTDSFEPDNTFTSAKAYTGPQIHYLYGATDADLVSFPVTSGSSYTVKTSSLLNGADTVITVYRSDQSTIAATNDNSPYTHTYSGYVTPYDLQQVPSDIFGFLCDSYGVCHDNGQDTLGSKLSFSAPSTGTYYVKVQSSATRPVSAGRYGTYTLTITSP